MARLAAAGAGRVRGCNRYDSQREETVDTSRISFGEMVAAVSGLLLFIFMFVGWYGVEDVSGSANAWESFSFIDILLFLAAVVAVSIAVLRAADAMPAELPAPPGLIVAGAGALAVLLILFRLIATPDFDVLGVDVDTTRKIGVFLGLLAAAGIAYGGYMAMNERASGAAPPAGPAGGTAPPPGGTTPPSGGEPPPRV
jgi:purine-cytosine permease-like protein